MKKPVTALILCFALFFSLFYSASAESISSDSSTNQIIDSTEYVYLSDGSYIVIELATLNSPKSASTFSSTYTRSGEKYVTRYTADNNILWRYTLSASFSINSGVSATCTSASYSTDINLSNWFFKDGSATKSGNTAYGKGTFEYKILYLFVTDTVNIDISISCDANGNLS